MVDLNAAPQEDYDNAPPSKARSLWQLKPPPKRSAEHSP